MFPPKLVIGDGIQVQYPCDVNQSVSCGATFHEQYTTKMSWPSCRDWVRLLACDRMPVRDESDREFLHVRRILESHCPAIRRPAQACDGAVATVRGNRAAACCTAQYGQASTEHAQLCSRRVQFDVAGLIAKLKPKTLVCRQAAPNFVELIRGVKDFVDKADDVNFASGQFRVNQVLYSR
jgi:hypothetical protein